MSFVRYVRHRGRPHRDERQQPATTRHSPRHHARGSDRAVALNPNSADSHALRAVILNFIGDPAQASEEMDLATRLNPDPHWYWVRIGRAQFLLGRYEEAIPRPEALVDVAEEVLS